MDRRVAVIALTVVALAGCSPFLSKQERTRRAVIGAWDDPKDPTASLVLADGGSFNMLGGEVPANGSWSTSETGGVAIAINVPLVGTETLAAVLQGDKLQVTLPNGQTGLFVREGDLAKQTPPLTDQAISTTLLHVEAQKCDFPYEATVGGMFNPIPPDGARTKFRHWLDTTLRHYQFVSESGGGRFHRYLQTGPNGDKGTITTDYYLSIVGETMDDLDREGTNYAKVYFCKMLPKAINIESRQRISARRVIVNYNVLTQGSPFFMDIVESEYAMLLQRSDEPKPGKKSANFIYTDGQWRNK